MMIDSNIRDYEVVFSDSFNFIKELDFDNRFVVIDKNVYNELIDLFKDGEYYVLDSIEENKTLAIATDIIDHIAELKSKRNTKLIAIGGGIVQDVSCFVSTVIYRGIDWYLVPTTLLAQTDSCIGSKSSINYNNRKNLLGTFYPPSKVFIDVRFIDSISTRDFYSGLGEILKCSVMQGIDAYRETKENIPKILEGDRNLLIHEMQKTLSFKKSIIEVDEFDRGIRNIMNYGHTFGHAIESATSYAIPHGQAVSIGIAIANNLSTSRNYISSEYANEIFETVKNIVSENSRMPTPESVLDFMKSDKKYKGGKHTCILIADDGVKKVDDVEDAEVLEAIKNTFLNFNETNLNSPLLSC